MYIIVMIILCAEYTVGRDIFNILSALGRAIIHNVKPGKLTDNDPLFSIPI